MCGQYGYYGTSAFNLVLDTKEMEILENAEVDLTDAQSEIEQAFKLAKADSQDECAKNQIAIKNNISNIKHKNAVVCDDDYNMGF